MNSYAVPITFVRPTKGLHGTASTLCLIFVLGATQLLAEEEKQPAEKPAVNILDAKPPENLLDKEKKPEPNLLDTKPAPNILDTKPADNLLDKKESPNILDPKPPAGGPPNLLDPKPAEMPKQGDNLLGGGLLPAPTPGGDLLTPQQPAGDLNLLIPAKDVPPTITDDQKQDEDKGPSPLTPEVVENMHSVVMEKSKGFPSAAECGKCHQQAYFEWSISNHAYASISPMFHKFEQKISEVTQGTVGYFCLRCHASVGTTIGETRSTPITQRTLVSREGITCVTCHRVAEDYGRVNGERRILAGDLSKPVYGNIGGDGIAKAINEHIGNVAPEVPNPIGKRSIHSAGIKFKTIDKSEFCVSCHQVAVHPGIKLEIVWEQFRGSPALAKGTSCQDCHMGKVPGKASGFDTGPAAIIGGKIDESGPERINGKLTGKVKLEEINGKVTGEVVNPNRKHSNHAFWGPGYPIDHPGIFPHNWLAKNNPKYDFTVEAWLTFDWRAGWGTEEFERKILKGESKPKFPPEWDKMVWRTSARTIVDQNLATLELKKQMRRQVLENGSRLDGPFFAGVNLQKTKVPSALPLGKPVKFYYEVTNTDEGHNLPSGSLGAQPEIWLNVALINPQGKNVWESGYLDSQGDMCDLHSNDVRIGKIASDSQLFNLQSKFMTTNVKGTDREAFLPVPFDIDPLPMLRPDGRPTTVLNHPGGIRMENRSLPPLSSRKANYSVPGDKLTVPGKYKLLVRLRSRAEPIYFMKFCGASPEMIRSMNQWMLDIHPYAVEFEIR